MAGDTMSRIRERRCVVDGTSGLRRARRLAHAAATESLEPDRHDDVELVVSELVTNAIEHGSGGDVEVVVRHEPGSLEVSVCSVADSLPVPQHRPAPAHHTRGRGLPIVAALSDSVMITGDHDSVRVTCRFGRDASEPDRASRDR
jgi:anti-sigma regulatory factor (Ser/Thr protein kinase)